MKEAVPPEKLLPALLPVISSRWKEFLETQFGKEKAAELLDKLPEKKAEFQDTFIESWYKRKLEDCEKKKKEGLGFRVLGFKFRV